VDNGEEGTRAQRQDAWGSLSAVYSRELVKGGGEVAFRAG